MATHIVGARKPARLGKNFVAAQQPVNPNAMFYVVNKNAVSTLTGYKAIKCKNYTMYAVFATQQQASAFVAAKHMQLYAAIVCM